ncbi:hypothetical protein J6590_074816 [Homalodisca vitripennis]|nr:hypothetical protein J6590_074816 [Homalodisca vitripennis]
MFPQAFMSYRQLGLLTLPCLYILEVVLYCRSKCNLVQGRDIHQYGTSGRDNFRVQQHRTAAFESFLSEMFSTTRQLLDGNSSINMNIATAS